MAIIKSEAISASAGGFGSLPIVKQIGLLVGLAASIALGVAVVLWSQDPDMVPLYSSIDSKETANISDALRQNNIKFDYDRSIGTILVPNDKVHEARIKLSAQGLPKSSGDGNGYELLSKDPGFGTSQFMESVRYRQAIEGELSRTISSFRNIKTARVHLALPKQSSFIRNRKKPSASVLLNVYSGHRIDQEQVSAIRNLVASSVAGMTINDVTIADQHGRLLSDGDSGDSVSVANKKLNYIQQVENNYLEQIEDILTPILGEGNYRAQVAADVDFTATQQATEQYNPDSRALRSERVFNEENSGKVDAKGIPGAASNKPEKNEAAGEKEDAKNPQKLKNQAVRNYELDKTIKHVKNEAGRVKRLSVAVVLDDRKSIDPDSGEVSKKPVTDKEIEQITNLVKNAVGYNEKRGDSVSVLYMPFLTHAPIEALPEIAMWKQPWVKDAIKQVLGAIFILFLVLAILKPILKQLASQNKKDVENQQMMQTIVQQSEAGIMPQQNQMMMQAQANNMQLAGPGGASYEQKIGKAQEVANMQPEKVAKVIKNWVEE